MNGDYKEEWYMQTPTLAALSKLINMYYIFKIGYDRGLADDLNEYILKDEELSALEQIINNEKTKTGVV